MNKNDLNKLIEIRQIMIEIYDGLEHKTEDFAQVSQKAVALEIEKLVILVDKILEGKVKFT